MANTNMTFAEIQSAVQTEMQLDPGLISIDERKRFINDAIADLGGVGSFQKQVDLSLTGGAADLPDDFVDFIAVVRNKVLLNPTSIRDRINGYLILYNKLEVFPQDTDVVTLYYAYRPAKLVLDDDKPDIPNGYDLAIRDYAVARAHRKNGNIGLYREYMSAYEDSKFKLQQELIRRENASTINILNSEELTAPKGAEELII